MNPNEVLSEIQGLTRDLIQCSLCVAHVSPSLNTYAGGRRRIEIPGEVDLSAGMSASGSYEEAWRALDTSRTYHMKLIDGALVQLLYTFGDSLTKHRLAYFPSPSLLNYEQASEDYDADEVYADIVGAGLVHIPLRFDFEQNAASNEPLHHPITHLSLGQYPTCRIPVSAPLSPRRFLEFILRNFYHSAYRRHAGDIRLNTQMFPATLLQVERRLVHMAF